MDKKKEATEDTAVKVEIKDFKELPKTEPTVKLKMGEVLIAELDNDGKEVKTFVTNQHSADTYFNDAKKFQIKKKG